MLGALELVASGRTQLLKIVWTEVCQGMSFEPSPEIFDWIQVRCVRWQECDLNMAIGTVQIFANQFRFVCPEPVENDQK